MGESRRSAQALLRGPDLLPCSFSAAGVTVVAIISHPMFSLIRDMGREVRDPIQHGEHLDVSFEDGVHLGMAEEVNCHTK